CQHIIPFGGYNLFDQFSLVMIIVNDQGKDISLFFHTLGVSPPGYRTHKVLCNIIALLFFRIFRRAARWVDAQGTVSIAFPTLSEFFFKSGRILKIRPWMIYFQALHLEHCKRHSYWRNQKQENV